uniref:Probable G-protein coupled receptor 33 n=2 Tax=Latimeria chalumnae TaxID=7897 RepID=H3AZK8_LATCH
MSAYNSSLLSVPAIIERDKPYGPASPKAVKVVIAVLFSCTFLIGLVVNGTFIWIIGCRMKRTVNTIWFMNLIFANLLFIILLPVLVVDIITPGWWLGMTPCKLVNTSISLCLFSMVFLLTVISLDRLMLTLNPIWARNHRTNRKAAFVIVSVWIVAGLFSSPYLAFRDIRINDENETICFNNYALSSNHSSASVQETHKKVQVAMFVSRFLFGFVIPFLIITTSYVTMAMKIKSRHLSSSSKPFKIIATAVLSFFVCWLPYHIYSYVMTQRKSDAPLTVVEKISALIASLTTCFHSCFTPLLYIFISGGFKGVFKKSIFSLFEMTFSDGISQKACSTAEKSEAS